MGVIFTVSLVSVITELLLCRNKVDRKRKTAQNKTLSERKLPVIVDRNPHSDAIKK